MLSLRGADVFPVVASLFLGGREATTGNTSALRRLGDAWSVHVFFPKTKQIANPKFNLHLYFFAAEVKMLNEIKQT